jgi:malate synthase
MNQMISGLTVQADLTPEMLEVLTPEALAFVRQLQTRFGARRIELLAAREMRQERIEAGEMPDFLPETKNIRDGEWRVLPPPKDLEDRRAEITGPVDRKMVINALNSGAKVFMADFEDANSPSWSNCVLGQINLRDAIRRTISFSNPDGKQYALNEKTATLKVRPRGWHLPEKHVTLEGESISGGLFDFGLYVFHNAKELLSRGSGPYFYLPKLESHLEARLWNEVFSFSEEYLDIPYGSIRATVLIETILAAFEMEEILYELRDHSVGLNCGRWDYIFSTIKKFRLRSDFVMPDRAKVTMTAHMMRSYSLLAIKTCHKRGAHAIGGMSAFIPVKNDVEANNKATEQVRTDKTREATDGHDGTWVAHPGLVPVALEVFDRIMPSPNQIDKQLEINVTAKDLLTVPTGGVTLAGLTLNISVALQYLEAWLNGSGAVPINNLMEDAATAEISRAQIWQWIEHHTKLEDGGEITLELVKSVLDTELERLGRTRFAKAAGLLLEVATAKPFIEFLTLPGYREMA